MIAPPEISMPLGSYMCRLCRRSLAMCKLFEQLACHLSDNSATWELCWAPREYVSPNNCVERLESSLDTRDIQLRDFGQSYIHHIPNMISIITNICYSKITHMFLMYMMMYEGSHVRCRHELCDIEIMQILLMSNDLYQLHSLITCSLW